MNTLVHKNVWMKMESERLLREENFPTERDALLAICDARQRLIELGWSEGVCAPKDGSSFEVCDPGSSGIHRCFYSGDWPSGSWMYVDGGDLYPSSSAPMLYRLIKG